jgi:cytochrome c1
MAGSLHNGAANVERWIEDPHTFNAQTAMPNVHVTPKDAADLTQYLDSL